MESRDTMKAVAIDGYGHVEPLASPRFPEAGNRIADLLGLCSEWPLSALCRAAISNRRSSL
ncbi:hypothetical protein [Thioclava sp. ES.031]|uniref:hypothetical protein n=1 Tax=Thioclava sp. ES.031 TaxID=1798203 RepID=UPI000BF3405C|nr:hypothetical protein [Thioclava sp. ES.031]